MQILSNFYGTDGRTATITKEGDHLYCNFYINKRVIAKINRNSTQELENLAEDFVSNQTTGSELLNE
jgi:hypothetical protein